MIVSASRRTDIPALYADWLVERLREGYALAQNPMNARQIRRVVLQPENTEFVFWTKNAQPLLSCLSLLQPFPYYVQFTITPYGREIEPGLPPQTERLQTFRRLSDAIGPDRIVWRCDPLFWGRNISTDWLTGQFIQLAEALSGWTRRCTISFVDVYRCMARRFADAGLRPGEPEEKLELAKALQTAASERGLLLAACCEPDLEGILPPAHCIDAELLAEIAGRDVPAHRDRNQRPLCGCSASVDIGVYGSCLHGCVYCYALRSTRTPAERYARLDISNPLLLGRENVC